jgi:hypothetical protein
LFGAQGFSELQNRKGCLLQMVGKEVQIHRTFLAGSHISPLTETGAPMSTTLSTIPSVHQNHVSTQQAVNFVCPGCFTVITIIARLL